VTSLPTCRQLAPGSVAHNQFGVLPKLDALVGGETTPNGYPHAFMFNPDIRHSVIFPINPIYSQSHPGILNVDNSILGILPFLEFSNIAPFHQPYLDVGRTIWNPCKAYLPLGLIPPTPRLLLGLPFHLSLRDL
jgi:hypothetical protein